MARFDFQSKIQQNQSILAAKIPIAAMFGSSRVESRSAAALPAGSGSAKTLSSASAVEAGSRSSVVVAISISVVVPLATDTDVVVALVDALAVSDAVVGSGAVVVEIGVVVTGVGAGVTAAVPAGVGAGVGASVMRTQSKPRCWVDGTQTGKTAESAHGSGAAHGALWLLQTFVTAWHDEPVTQLSGACAQSSPTFTAADVSRS